MINDLKALSEALQPSFEQELRIIIRARKAQIQSRLSQGLPYTLRSPDGRLITIHPRITGA